MIALAAEAFERMKQNFKNALRYLLRGYKWAISPLFPPSCRYVPTCSEYAMEAIEHYGILKGGVKTLWRLLRCHPFANGGYDPVTMHGCCANNFEIQTLRPTER